MPFWVNGRDSQTGQATDPFFSEAGSEEAAREEATAQGMIVESVERHTETERSPQRAPPPAPMSEEPMSAGRGGGGGYELGSEQRALISSLAWYMRVLGVVLIVLGGFQLTFGLLANRSGNAGPLIQGLLGLIMGGLTAGVASNFRRVVESRGQDISHLMDALSGLKLIYAIQVWVFGIALAAVAVAILFAGAAW